MKLNFAGTAVKINVSFAAAVTLTLIVDESGLCALALFCCIIHEAGHIICLLILGEKPSVIELSFYGIRLERSLPERVGSFDEILVLASGPAANLVLSALLLPFGAHGGGIKTAAAASLCVAAFNLLPCRPLDGGNILRYALCRFGNEERAEKICFFISCAVIAPMLAAGLALLLKNGNFTLAAVSLYLAAALFLDKREKNI